MSRLGTYCATSRSNAPEQSSVQYLGQSWSTVATPSLLNICSASFLRFLCFCKKKLGERNPVNQSHPDG